MLALSVVAFAQTKEAITPVEKGFPTTLQPANPAKEYEPQKAKKKKPKTATYDARRDYDKRVEKNFHERSRKFEKGETIDQMMAPYFGHKRPPKVRPIDKRKLCKVCGIKH